MKPTSSFLFLFAFCIGFLALPNVEANAPLGTLFVATKPFPKSASSDEALIKKGRQHREEKLRLAPGGDLSFHLLLVLKNKFRGKQIYFVVYPAGSNEYLAASPIQVKPGIKRLISPMAFSGDFQRGKTYELRATWPRQQGKKVIETILGRTKFSL